MRESGGTGSHPTSRIPELDALRGVAAIGVVLWHYANHFHAKPLRVLLHPLYNGGGCFVDFFFVLSGFVLTRAYLRRGRRKRIARNLAERVARLYPLHLVTLLLVMLGQMVLTRWMGRAPFTYSLNDTGDFVLNLLLANCFAVHRGFSFNGPSWSTSAELFTNMLFFAVVAKTERPWTHFAALMLCALITLALFGHGGLIRGQMLVLNQPAILRACLGFFMGALLPYLVQRLNLGDSRISKLLVDGLFVACGLVVYWFLCNREAQNSMGLAYMMVVVVFPLIVFAAWNGRVVSRILQNRPLVYLGTISYSVYLLHFPLQLLLHIGSVSGHISIDFSVPLSLIAFLSVTVALAALTYHVVELPGKRFVIRMVETRHGGQWRRRTKRRIRAAPQAERSTA